MKPTNQQADHHTATEKLLVTLRDQHTPRYEFDKRQNEQIEQPDYRLQALRHCRQQKTEDTKIQK